MFGTVSDMDVAVWAMDDVADFGPAAVLQTFALANSLRETLPTPPPPWRVHTVSSGASVRSGNGYTIPTVPLADRTDRAAEFTDLGVTERSLQRATQAELGMSPRDFVNDIRLEHAAFLLRTTSLPLEAIASRVGYLNAGTLRGLVRRRRGMTIAQLRATPLAW